MEAIGTNLWMLWLDVVTEKCKGASNVQVVLYLLHSVVSFSSWQMTFLFNTGCRPLTGPLAADIQRQWLLHHGPSLVLKCPWLSWLVPKTSNTSIPQWNSYNQSTSEFMVVLFPWLNTDIIAPVKTLYLNSLLPCLCECPDHQSGMSNPFDHQFSN